MVTWSTRPNKVHEIDHLKMPWMLFHLSLSLQPVNNEKVCKQG